MNTLLLILAVTVAFGGICFLGSLAFLMWVARGESDVNGDPERDASPVGRRDAEPLDYALAERDPLDAEADDPFAGVPSSVLPCVPPAEHNGPSGGTPEARRRLVARDGDFPRQSPI